MKKQSAPKNSPQIHSSLQFQWLCLICYLDHHIMALDAKPTPFPSSPGYDKHRKKRRASVKNLLSTSVLFSFQDLNVFSSLQGPLATLLPGRMTL